MILYLHKNKHTRIIHISQPPPIVLHRKPGICDNCVCILHICLTVKYRKCEGFSMTVALPPGCMGI